MKRASLKGSVKASSKKNRDGSCTAVYSVTNSQGFVPSTEYFSKEVFSKELRTYKVVERGMIAYNPSRINVGSVAIQNRCDRAIVSPLYVVFSVDESKFLPEFILRFLRSNVGLEQIAFQSTGTVRNNLKFEALERLEVPVAPIDWQQDCIDRLSAIDLQVDLYRQLLNKLDELVKSRFVEMFGDPVTNEMGWETLTLEGACSCIVDCPHSTPSYTDEETGYRCIRTSTVKPNSILWDKVEFIPENEYFERIKRHTPTIGDVVYTREGAILGIAAPIDRDIPVALGQRSMLLTPDQSTILPMFLSSAMNFDSFLFAALKNVTGSASPHINVKDIRAFRLAIPPIDLQREFEVFVQQVDKLKFETQQAIDKLQMLYDSLAQEYFGDGDAYD